MRVAWMETTMGLSLLGFGILYTVTFLRGSKSQSELNIITCLCNLRNVFARQGGLGGLGSLIEENVVISKEDWKGS